MTPEIFALDVPVGRQGRLRSDVVDGGESAALCRCGAIVPPVRGRRRLFTAGSRAWGYATAALRAARIITPLTTLYTAVQDMISVFIDK